MADINDVARRAGVSTATVSRALRGLDRVAEATRLRVLEAADELGYTISPAASRLAGGKSRTIAVVVPFVTRWFFGQVIAGAEATLREAGYDMLLYNLGDAEGRNRLFSGNRLRDRVDAALVLSLPLEGSEVAALQALNVPVSVVGSFPSAFSGVRIDDVEASRTAVQHLIHLGHEKIGLISGVPVDEGIPFTSQVDRRIGYSSAMANGGLDVLPDLEAIGHFTLNGGAQAMTRLLSGRIVPSAVFVESDEMAFGALLALRRAGMRAGEDMSVVGFDGHEMAELMDLTTMVQPVRQQGVVAAQHLLAALENSTTEPQHTTLATELILRGSTAPNGRRQ
ncbi:LacI family DNA-binding transcriptional regulator [Streptomyces rubiginosohelvolus]|uniref:LacI family DNA-binding transcriptional regulator n=1 Tax=Streptomyces rubiginosohelvolus TaxID=67362 RepID=UPI0036923AA2